MSRIRLSIGEVVLRGFEPGDRAALLQGLEDELRRVLADPAGRAAWARSHRTPVVKLPRLPFTPGPSGGRRFGVQMGRAIGERLKP